MWHKLGPRVGNVRKWQSDVFFLKKKGTYPGKSLITFSYSLSLSYSLCKLQKGIVENTIKKQLKHRGKNG